MTKALFIKKIGAGNVIKVIFGGFYSVAQRLTIKAAGLKTLSRLTKCQQGVLRNNKYTVYDARSGRA